ncbi:hypothetical protein FACS189443_3700 [Planctomycetales bacterium]|nr:hypothetical protein FACS189443_3700 [Planctomycetales bacterium]
MSEQNKIEVPQETTDIPENKPTTPTDTFEEWNLQDGDGTEQEHFAVLDGKIIARMPDLGNALSVKTSADSLRETSDTESDEPSAWELLKKAIAVALKRRQKTNTAVVRPNANTEHTVSGAKVSRHLFFSRVMAVGLVVLICGAGILFLDKRDGVKKDSLVDNVLNETLKQAAPAPTGSEIKPKVAAAPVVVPTASKPVTNEKPVAAQASVAQQKPADPNKNVAVASVNPVSASQPAENKPAGEQQVAANISENKNIEVITTASSSPWDRSPVNPYEAPTQANTVVMQPIQSPANGYQQQQEVGFGNSASTLGAMIPTHGRLENAVAVASTTTPPQGQPQQTYPPVYQAPPVYNNYPAPQSYDAPQGYSASQNNYPAPSSYPQTANPTPVQQPNNWQPNQTSQTSQPPVSAGYYQNQTVQPFGTPIPSGQSNLPADGNVAPAQQQQQPYPYYHDVPTYRKVY